LNKGNKMMEVDVKKLLTFSYKDPYTSFFVEK